MEGRFDIDYLREIGRILSMTIPPLRFSSTVKDPLETGASGDRTFQIDRTAEQTVVGALKELDTPFTIVSEEMGMVDLLEGGPRVLIDPIDGSKNAISGIPLFCTSIAVSEDGTVRGLYMAYIINLTSGDEFWAERGKGAYWNGRRMKTQDDDSISVVLYETQNPRRDLAQIIPLLGRANRTRCFGSTALDLAFLASGAASIYVNPAPSRSFDFSAGVLLLKEAGGIVTDIEGHTIDGMELSMKTAAPLLVSGNTGLHKKALVLLSEQG
jgi:myo-inositol-1(or 4)-monophosphatase